GGILRISGRSVATAPKESGLSESPCVAISLEDTGSGIAPHHIGRVFEPFFTTKDVGRGTGLGLSIAYGIVKEHGGGIQIASVLEEGTGVTVFLPVQRAVPMEPSVLEEARA